MYGADRLGADVLLIQRKVPRCFPSRLFRRSSSELPQIAPEHDIPDPLGGRRDAGFPKSIPLRARTSLVDGGFHTASKPNRRAKTATGILYYDYEDDDDDDFNAGCIVFYPFYSNKLVRHVALTMRYQAFV